MATVRAGDLIGAGWGVLTRQGRWLLGGGVVVAAMQTAQQLARPQFAGGAWMMVLVVLAMIVQFLIHGVVGRRAMESEGLVEPGTPARYVLFAWASLVVTFGATLASLLLVVPGVMLMLRWFLATNFVLGRGMDLSQALAASGEATRGHRWSILGTWAVLWVVMGVPYGLMAWSVGLTALSNLSVLTAFGLGRVMWTVAVTAASMALSIGVYGVLATRTNTLSDVFS